MPKPPLDPRAATLGRLSQPHTYAEERLGMKLHPVQRDILKSIFASKGSRVVSCCANEVGKTRKILAAAVLYAIEMKGAIAVSTAGTFRQIKSQLIPALKDHAHKFDPNLWHFQDTGIKRFDLLKNVWVDAYIGVSTKDEHYFQGYHRDEGRELFIATDESQGISNEIMGAAEDRCNPTWFYATGSPGDPAGVFYDMQTSLSSHYVVHKLNRMQCLKEDGWWLDKSDIDRLIAKHGADNPFIQSTVFGAYSGRVEGAMISLGEYDRCLENPPQWTGRDRHGACDFAAGRDKNVYARRLGNQSVLRRKWVQRDTMAACGEFLGMFIQDKREFGMQPEEISGDADGLGLPICQRLRELGWPINEFHGGAKERYGNGYRNQISEAWGEGVKKIIACETILPEDKDLKAQILGRKGKPNSSGQMEIESKEDYKKRAGESPDEADAYFMSLMPAPGVKSFSMLRPPQQDWRATLTDEQPEQTGERRYFQ